MTPEEKAEIDRLLGQLLTDKEAELFWDTPQAYLNGGYPASNPRRTIEVLQAIVDGAYL